MEDAEKQKIIEDFMIGILKDCPKDHFSVRVCYLDKSGQLAAWGMNFPNTIIPYWKVRSIDLARYSLGLIMETILHDLRNPDQTFNFYMARWKQITLDFKDDKEKMKQAFIDFHNEIGFETLEEDIKETK